MGPFMEACLLMASLASCGFAQYFNQQPLYYDGANNQLQLQEPIYILQEEQSRPVDVYQSRPAVGRQQQQRYIPQPQPSPVRQQYQQPQQVYQRQPEPQSQAYNPLYSAQQLRPVVAPGPRQGRQGGLGGSCKDAIPTEDASQCDKYYTCENGEQVEKLCADGLVFNPRVPRSRRKDPCYYPQEVECGSRSQLQPAQATDQCPRQFALFGTGDRVNCGQYVSCAHGVAYTLPCPEDLAWSDETGRCEWPDEVPSCDAAAYLQYSCPAPSADGALDYYPDTQNCRKFIVCVDGLPRRITCGEGTVYNPQTQTCDDPKNVPGCESYYGRQKRNSNTA